MSVLLIRHADAGNRHRWTGPDEARPLTDLGWRQARGLVELLAGERIGRILSSPYLRCRQTVEPLAQSRGLPIEDSPALIENAPIDPVLTLIAEVGDAALSTHGDIVGGVIEHLTRRAVPLEGGLQWEKASTWILTVANGQVVQGRYVPPPPV
jgi:8-oxo-dGTP diphosphatase